MNSEYGYEKIIRVFFYKYKQSQYFKVKNFVYFVSLEKDNDITAITIGGKCYFRPAYKNY